MRLPVYWKRLTLLDTLPSNVIIEIYGFESSGKTVLALSWAEASLKINRPVIYFDSEYSLFSNYLENYELSKMEIVKPEYMEGIFERIENVKNTLIIWDTLASTPTKQELEEKGIAMQARILSQLLRIHNQKLKTHDNTLVILNQARNSLTPYQSAISPGGLALDFYSDIKIFIKKKDQKDSYLISELVTKKNRFAPPGKTSRIVFINGRYSEIDTIIENAKDMNILKTDGARYIFKGEKIAKKEIDKYIKNILEEIYDKIC